MLCDHCSLHFSPSLVSGERYLELKEEALTLIKEIAESDDIVLLFESEVEAYRKAFDSSDGDHLPCPWSKQDFSWIKGEVEFEGIDVWEDKVPLHIISEGAAGGCDLCKRLDTAAIHFGDAIPDLSVITFESRLVLDPISLIPQYLEFDINLQSDNHYLCIWVVFEEGKS